MTEDTVVTPVLRKAAESWRTWAPWAAAVAAAVWAFAVSLGGKAEHSADLEANYARDQITLKRYEEEMRAQMDRMEGKVDALSMLPAKVDDLGRRQDRMEDNWDTAFQHAGDFPRPSHRAHKP